MVRNATIVTTGNGNYTYVSDSFVSKATMVTEVHMVPIRILVTLVSIVIIVTFLRKCS